MLRLPVEILHEIFLQLHQHDKLTCMTVCKHWKFVIEKYSLYRTIRITKVEQLYKLISRLQRDVLKAQSLQRLILNLHQENNFNFGTLIQAFPNVQSVTTFQSCVGKIPPQGHFTWASIKQIEEYASHSLTGYLLEQKECIHLTKLILGGFDFKSGNKTIQLLAKAPSLKYLTLINATLKLQDFELLHSNVPCLKSLDLRGGFIQCQTLQHQARPAPSLTTLHMKRASLLSVEHEMKLLQYFAAKYTNIDELTYYIIRPEILRTAHQHVSDYREHFMAFINAIGSKLTRLSLRLTKEGFNVLQILDRTSCKINNMTLMSSIRQSDVVELSSTHQAQYIQQLSIKYHCRKVFPFNCLGLFTKLDYLSIVYPTNYGYFCGTRNVFYFTNILENDNNQLKSLYIFGAEVAFEQVHLEEGHSLDSLAFSKCKIPPHLDLLIARSFPHLRTLVFDSCKFDDNSLVFPGISLNYFKVVCSLSKSFNNVQVISLENNERRRYSSKACHFSYHVDQNDMFILPPMISKPDNAMPTPRMTFIFNSVRNCSVINSIY